MTAVFFGGLEGPLRTIVVGIFAYLMLVAFLRISGKRTLTKLNAFDLVVTVALGSTLATILLSRDVPLLDGAVAFAVLVGMQFLITFTSQRVPTIARLAKSEPRALLYRGTVLRGALRDERVLESELQAAMRSAGAATYDELDLVVLETDGSISVIRRLPEGPSPATASLSAVHAEQERAQGTRRSGPPRTRQEGNPWTG